MLAYLSNVYNRAHQLHLVSSYQALVECILLNNSVLYYLLDIHPCFSGSKVDYISLKYCRLFQFKVKFLFLKTDLVLG